MAGMEQIIARLEAATTRLEALAAGGGSHAAGSTPSGSSSEMLEGFEEILKGPLAKFIELSNKIGGDVKTQAEFFDKAFHAQRDFLAVASKSKKPSAEEIQKLLKSTSDNLSAAVEFKEKHRSSKEFNHLSAIAEGIPALGWVLAEPKPVPHINQMKEGADFYTNRILKDFKDKDETHVQWAKTFPTILIDLGAYVKKYHTTGVTWNPKGGDASSASSSTPAPSKPAEPAKPAEPKPAAEGPPKNVNLFSALNKGEGITSGLKKVEKDQMTHKNPALRAAGVVQAKDEKEEKETPAATGKTADQPPKLALEGNKWAVEWQKNNKNIVIEQPEAKHAVYVYKCTNSTIVVKGKINQITLDSCKKVAVVLENVISGVDVINSQSCQIQITGKAPTITIDKTDGCQVYLSKEGMSTEIFTAKSSEVNVLVPGKKEDDDMRENALPEQLKSVFNGEKMITTIVEHKA